MEECGRNRDVSQRGRAKLISISLSAGNLFEAEVLVLPRSGKDDVAEAIAKAWGDLRHADRVRLEVGKHFIRLARHRVAGHTSCLPEEDQRPAFFLGGHCAGIAACKLVDWRVGKYEGELEFRDRLAEHEEVDRS